MRVVPSGMMKLPKPGTSTQKKGPVTPSDADDLRERLAEAQEQARMLKKELEKQREESTRELKKQSEEFQQIKQLLLDLKTKRKQQQT